MKRSTWIAIVLAAGVLVLAGDLPRLPWDALAGSWQRSLARQVAAWPRRARRAPAPVPVPPVRLAVAPAPPPARLALPRAAARPVAPAGPGWPLEVIAGAALGALAGLVTLALLARVAPGDRRGRVYRLARRGHSAGRIARRAHVPQDAVRTLLSPGVGARR